MGGRERGTHDGDLADQRVALLFEVGFPRRRGGGGAGAGCGHCWDVRPGGRSGWDLGVAGAWGRRRGLALTDFAYKK
jgi:hypothetical protein